MIVQGRSALLKEPGSSENKMTLCYRCLGPLIILLQFLIDSLLFYGLILGAGDLVAYGCERIGFYNFCFLNETMKDCRCLSELKELSLVGLHTHQGLVLAFILTYSSLVFIIFGMLAMFCALYCKERILWKVSLIFDVLAMIGLGFGMIVFIFIVWDWFDITRVTPGFWAVVGSFGGMFVLCWFTTLMLKVRSVEPSPAEQSLL